MDLGTPLRTEIIGVQILFWVPKEIMLDTNIDIKYLVKDQRVHFKFYRDNALYYETDSGFRFPIPVEDMNSGVFLPDDKAILYMRWIRKALDTGNYRQRSSLRGVAQ